ncbi:MAG: glycosyltransferase [bacterium]
MRILKITQTYFPYLSKGGPPAKVRAIARALVERGHEVTVLTADRGQKSEIRGQRSEGAEKAEGEEERSESRGQKSGWEVNDHGVETVYLRTLQSYRATTINPGILRFCANRLRDFDVVHIYGLYDLLGSTVGWFCRRRGIPYILEPLGMFGPKVRSQRKKNLYRKLVGNGLFAGAQIVIATSETERTELIAGGLSDSKIVVRRNGIDLDDFKTLPRRGAFRAEHNIALDIPLVVFLGRLSFIKGLDLLVKAFAQVDSKSHLVIAGPDDADGCSHEVKKLIDELQLRDRVTLSAPLYGLEKLQAFVDADFVVLPSRYESFGNVAAEAIACGTPVLVTDECGIAPLVKGSAGLVVACSVEALRDGLKLLIADKSLLSQLRAGAPGVAGNLSWEEPVAAMELLYESLVPLNAEIQPQINADNTNQKSESIRTQRAKGSGQRAAGKEQRAKGQEARSDENSASPLELRP